VPRRSPYAALLSVPGVLRLCVIAFVARLPYAMTGVVLTLHVVTTLDRSYAEAGLVTAASTIGMALGGPWRGRLVDRAGLRRAVAPSVVVTAAVWFTAPHLPYHALIAAAFVAGVYTVPVFPVTRQSLSVLVPAAQQQTGFALDAVLVEVTFMVAPVVGVAVATSVSTTAALMLVAICAVGGGALFLWANPPTRTQGQPAVGPAADGRVVTPALIVVLFALAAAAFVLMGTDVALVATLNEAGRSQDIGWMVALWCLGSVGGGLVYGSRGSSWSPLALVALLAAATLPVAFLTTQPWLAVAVVVAGIPCAPMFAACTASLVRLVPEPRRGEVMGWSGTSQTVGNALGAPLVGWVIDRTVPGSGFLLAACVGGVAAVGGLVALRVARARRAVAEEAHEAATDGTVAAGR
jgi:MFS family permease